MKDKNVFSWLEIRNKEFDYSTKCKIHPRRGHESPEEKQRYSSALSLTSALDGVGVQRETQVALPRGKDSVTIIQEAGWAPGPVRTGVKNLAPTGFRSSDLSARIQSLYRLRYPTAGDNSYLRLFNCTQKVKLHSNK